MYLIPFILLILPPVDGKPREAFLLFSSNLLHKAESGRMVG
jgi:hypothetical protein